MQQLTTSTQIKITSDEKIWFNALISTCYTCFFRIDKSFMLEMSDIVLKYDTDNIPYYSVIVRHRKVQIKEPKKFWFMTSCHKPKQHLLTLYIKLLNQKNVYH